MTDYHKEYQKEVDNLYMGSYSMWLETKLKEAKELIRLLNKSAVSFSYNTKTKEKINELWATLITFSAPTPDTTTEE